MQKIASYDNQTVVGWIEGREENSLVPIDTTLLRDLVDSTSIGTLKINVDVAVRAYMKYFGVVIVAIDSHGVVVFIEGLVLQGQFSPYTVEAYAILEGCIAADEYKYYGTIVETDAEMVVQALSIQTAHALKESVLN